MNKSILVYPLWFLYLIVLLSGCKKDSPEVPEKPVIKLEVSNSNPEFGGTSIVTWEVIGEYETMSVRINGENISASSKGEKIIQNIKNRQIISILCWIRGVSEPVQARIEIVPKEEIIVVVNPPIITSISISPETLPVGGGISTINISASNAEQIFLAGAWVEFSSPFQFSTNWINQDTSFVFILKGEGGEISTSVSIKVEIPLTDQELKEAMLTFGPWREVFSRESYNEEGGPWTIRNIDYDAPCAIDNSWTFSLNPKKVILSDPFPCGGANPYVHIWDWSLNGDILSGFGDRKIIYISWDQMIWKQLGHETDWATGEPVTVPIWIETTFIHPN